MLLSSCSCLKQFKVPCRRHVLLAFLCAGSQLESARGRLGVEGVGNFLFLLPIVRRVVSALVGNSAVSLVVSPCGAACRFVRKQEMEIYSFERRLRFLCSGSVALMCASGLAPPFPSSLPSAPSPVYNPSPSPPGPPSQLR